MTVALINGVVEYFFKSSTLRMNIGRRHRYEVIAHGLKSSEGFMNLLKTEFFSCCLSIACSKVICFLFFSQGVYPQPGTYLQYVFSNGSGPNSPGSSTLLCNDTLNYIFCSEKCQFSRVGRMTHPMPAARRNLVAQSLRAYFILYVIAMQLIMCVQENIELSSIS